MSNKFEIGKTYVVLKDFRQYRKGDEIYVDNVDCDGHYCEGQYMQRDYNCLVHTCRLVQGYVKLKKENIMSNTITQLEKQALEMQKKLDEMKATIEQQKKAEQESKKKKENVFGLGVALDQIYYYFTTPVANIFRANGSATREGKDDDKYSTAFNNKSKAEAMAEAFNVLLELRACEGVVEAEDGMSQYYIEFYKDGRIGTDDFSKVSGSLSPFFDSRQAAQDALAKVGEERVRKAFLAMQGTFE